MSFMERTDAYSERGVAEAVGVSTKDLPGMKPVGVIRSMMIMASGRSWWEVQYANGKTIAEWDTVQGKIFSPLGNPLTSRWEEIPKAGLSVLRLLTPDGKGSELRTTGEYCLFQFKRGSVSVGAGIKSDLHCAFHVIGVVVDTNGSCECRAWDYREKKLIKFRDNVMHMAFDNIGPLNLGEAVGIK